MKKQTLLITGCASGIGLASARLMKERGWEVFASVRNPSDCDFLRAEGFHALHIDYQDANTIKSGLDAVLEATGGTLDAVFNNGAMATPALIEDLPRAALRDLFETNFFGVHDLTRAVIPVMRAQRHGRIVQCSSVLGFLALRARGAYNASKFALEGYTDTLRLELYHEPIHVILIEPGPIRTDFRKNARIQFEKWIDWENSARRGFYEKLLIPRLHQDDEKMDRFELPASAVAEKLYTALTKNNPKSRYRVTIPTHTANIAKRLLPTRSLDKLFHKS